MSFLLDLPEEIASELTGAVGKAFQFMSDELAKMGMALEALSARLDADDAPAPTASPPTS